MVQAYTLISLILGGLFAAGYMARILFMKFHYVEHQNRMIIDCSVKLIQRFDELSDQQEQLQLILKDVKLRSEPAHFVTRI